jgi:hypothetical protein
MCAITHFKPVMQKLRPAHATAGVPESWLIFPIGTLKTAAAAGVLLGLGGVPLIEQKGVPAMRAHSGGHRHSLTSIHIGEELP